MKINLKKEYLKKIKEINLHNKYYFEKNSPKISDYEYDKLKKEIIDIEKRNPEILSNYSPTLKVGYTKICT